MADKLVEFVDTEADRAWWRGRRDEVVINADLVYWSGRTLDACGRQGAVEAGEVLAGKKLELGVGGRGG